MRFLLVLVVVGCKSPEPEDSTPAGPDGVPPWPEWAHEHWIWEGESTQESALAIVDGYLDHGIDVGAIIIDSPWATGYSTFVWDPALFPDPQGMIDELHGKGVKVMTWTVPGINVDVQPLYDEAAAAGYFMQGTEDGGPVVVDWWKGEGSLIDYFNPDAVAWWHEQVDQTLATGIDGWKCDGLDFSAALASWSPGAGRKVDRLEYSHAYYRDFHDYTREVLGDDRINTARPIDTYGADVGGDVVAFAPVDINWAGWVGDQDATFEGLRMALRNMYWSSDYGYVAFGSDIGGYRTDSAYPDTGRSKELFVRWTQQGALSPVMENGGGGEHRPWMFDDETVDIYRDYVELHTSLLPYLRREGAAALDSGGSLMTFLGDVDYEYLLGPDLYVAPMLDDGTVREVTPPDAGSDWIYLFDPSVGVAGESTVSLDVPLASFPVLVRAGSRVAGELGL